MDKAQLSKSAFGLGWIRQKTSAVHEFSIQKFSVYHYTEL